MNPINLRFSRNSLCALRAYLIVSAPLHLLWETAQFPLYTLWHTGSRIEILYAIAHCTLGDLMIAMASLLVALFIIGDRIWPEKNFLQVQITTMCIGLAYTIFSEWLNVSVRQSWAYTEQMPIVPYIDAGLSPVLQWIIIPAILFWYLRKRLTYTNSISTRIQT